MILDELSAAARSRVEAAKAKKPLSAIRKEAEALAIKQRDFAAALRGNGLSVIAEVKKASPSKGIIAADFPYTEIAGAYEAAGAAAISVLTEPTRFLGDDRYLTEIKKVVSLPLLRKDFTVDEYQLYEAKLLGADAVLLIAALLPAAVIKEYLKICGELGLAALVEVHNAREVEQALAAGAGIIGVNNRNLKDFTVDINNSLRLRPLVPPEIIFVAESGISTAENLTALRQAGVDAVLIGETLMRSKNVKETLANLKGREGNS